jgi:hypothetical protein
MLLDIYDSEFIGHYFDNVSRILQFHHKLWNEKIGIIIFNDVIAYCIFSFSDSIGMTIDEDSSFLEKSLLFEYEKIPQNHGYTSYAMLDIDNEAHIKIVAKGFSFVTKNE